MKIVGSEKTLKQAEQIKVLQEERRILLDTITTLDLTVKALQVKIEGGS